MRDGKRNSSWIIGLGVLAAAAVLALWAWIGRGADAPLIVQTEVAREKSAIPSPVAQPTTETPVRESIHEVTPSAPSPAWSFVVVDHADQGIEGAELMAGTRALARSDANGRVSVSAEDLDLEHAPRDVAWSVRHPRYRVGPIDASRIGRIDRVVLDDPWIVRVHVQAESGEAIAGAAGLLFEFRDGKAVELGRAVSDAHGTAVFADVLASQAVLSISAKGYEPYGRRLRANNGADSELTVVLVKGTELEVRVSDTHGRRVPRARVHASYTTVSVSEIAPAAWDETTNENGIAVLKNFPYKGRAMALTAEAEGYSRAYNSFMMSGFVAEKGIDMVLVPSAKLHVRVHESDGEAREATVGVYYADAGFGASGGARVTPTAGAGIGDYMVEVRASIELSLHAYIQGAAASTQVLRLEEGETRDVDVVVPHHVALDVRISGLAGACDASDVVTLTSIQGRLQVPTGLPGRGTASTLSYRATLDASCRARMWVQPGSYRAAFIHDNHALAMRDVEIRDALDLVLTVDEVRSVSGILRDARKTPLAGWTIVAKEQGGRRSYSARTSASGQFTLDGVMPSIVDLFAEMPDYLLFVPLVQSITPPIANLDLVVELQPVEVHTFDRDDGTKLGARLRVMSSKGFPVKPAERPTDDEGVAHLELPVGSFTVFAARGDRDRVGSTRVEIRAGAAERADMFLRKIRHRAITVKGAGDATEIHWKALEGPDAAEGSMMLIDVNNTAAFETDVPEGLTRFELSKDGEVFGNSIDVRVVNDQPTVLEW